MLTLAEIRGQERAVGRLRGELASGRVAHAYLFHGPAGVGKTTAALIFARALVCSGAGERPCGRCPDCRRAEAGNHPEICRVAPQGGSIKIRQVREVLHTLTYRPAGRPYRVVLLEEAEALTPEAGNALLKVLEEPPDGTVFLLVTAQPAALLPTVISRCRKVQFLPLAAEVIGDLLQAEGFPAERAVPAAALAGGSMTRGRELAGEGAAGVARAGALEALRILARQDAMEALALAERLAGQADRDAVLGWLALLYRDFLVWGKTGAEKLLANRDNLPLFRAGLPVPVDDRAVRRIEEARRQLRQNANPRLVLEVLCLELAGGPLTGEGSKGLGRSSGRPLPGSGQDLLF